MRAHVVALGILHALSLSAQSPRERPLKPGARFPEDFVGITSVRELADGRVFVTDPQGRNLVLADFASGKLDTIGRKGRGPNEFSFAAPLVELVGDSSIMALPTDRRWLLLDGPRIVATLPPDAPLVADGHFLSGADRDGHVLYERGEPTRSGVTITDHRDSSYVVLADRRTGRGDTVARKRIAESRREAQVDASGRILRSQMKMGSPLAVSEPARLLLDGWIFIVRRDPYRVDWRRPDGTWIHGAPLPNEKVRLTRTEREATMRYVAMRSGSRVGDPDFFDNWPEYYPPFPTGLFPVVSTPEGNVVIQRVQTANAPQRRYDLVNRHGQLQGRLVLNSNEVIAGFGKNAVYVVTIDDDGLHWLARHPWP